MHGRINNLDCNSYDLLVLLLFRECDLYSHLAVSRIDCCFSWNDTTKCNKEIKYSDLFNTDIDQSFNLDMLY